MKAIRVHEFGDAQVMKPEEVPDPQPGQEQVVVRVKAAGVNPVETYIRSGTYVRKPALPFTPGQDGAGVVESVGKEVSRIRPGDRVYIAGSLTGTYAEQVLCTQSQLYCLPQAVSFAMGASLGTPYATAYRALFQRARARPAEIVLVHGATGGVGIAALQFARAAGLEIIASGGSEKGRALLSEQGAHHVLDHHDPTYSERIPKLTQGHGVDVILEMLANVNLGKDLTLLSRGGRVVIIGSRGRVEISPRDAMTRDASILGMVLFNTPEQDSAAIHAAISAGLENGTLCPIIGQEIPLSDAPRAHQAVMAPGAYGKIVLIP